MPPKVTHLAPLPPSEAKWLQLQKATYTDSAGTSRAWEVASRKTRSSQPGSVDAVAIGNIIHRPSRPPSTMLVLQFRPPVDAVTVEWPAGLVDEGESAEQAALRELYEETGFSGGEVVSVSGAVAADPGMSSANMKLCMVEVWVKEGEEEPQQHLDEGEEIQRVEVPLRELYDKLGELEREGCVVAAKLWHWAAGARFAMERPELFGR